MATFSAVAAEAAPFAYVTNSSSNTVSVIDTATKTVVATAPMTVARWVAITPDGTLAYVANVDGTNVFVIDIPSNTVVDTVTGLNHPFGVAITPDGAFVYVRGDKNVWVIDTATNTVVATVQVGTGFRWGSHYTGTLKSWSRCCVLPCAWKRCADVKGDSP